MKQFRVIGKNLDVKGQKSFSFMLRGRKFHLSFLVCSLPTEAAGLLGTDILTETGAEINLEHGKMSLTFVNKAPRVFSVTRPKCASLPVFTEDTAGRSPQPMRREEPRLEEQPSANLRPAATTQGCRSWLVRATENIMLAPRCRQVAIERFRLRQRTAPPSPVCLEPALVHIQGILPARVLSLVKASTQETSSMTSQQGRVEKEASAN